jgi:hypothetical protein
VGAVGARCFQDRPFVLMGTSSGGCLAHSVATHLEHEGIEPDGIIHLDTYLPDAISPRLMEFLVHEYPREEQTKSRYPATTSRRAPHTPPRPLRPSTAGWPDCPLRPPATAVPADTVSVLMDQSVYRAEVDA